MNLRKESSNDYVETIKICWTADPEIQRFSRNSECDLDERIKREVEVFKISSDTFRFYKLYDNNRFVGYFGTETEPISFLSTIFIMPEYREVKKEIWDYIIKDFPETFYSGLFKVNTRAISFYKKMGGEIIKEIMVEDKPAVVFEFRRNLWH